MSNHPRQQQQAPEPAPSPTPAAAPEQDSAGQLYKLMFDVHSPEEAAEVLRANPEIAQRFVEALHKTYGNAFTAKAIELASTTDHSLISPDRGKLRQSETTSVVDTSAPTPTDKLPYTPEGWNGIEINRKLGQHDKIKGTDNDGDRCTFASALAMKIFDGPEATAGWLTSVLVRHDQDEGRAAKEPAEDVLRELIKAIRAKSATYADLSWAQEALYEVTLAKGQSGTTGVKQTDFVGREVKAYSISDDVGSEKIDKTAWSPQELLANAKALKKGERLMCGWITDNFEHQIMIANQDGKLYLYDSEMQADGVHLRDLTVAVLAPYFANLASVDIYLKVKATLPSAPK